MLACITLNLQVVSFPSKCIMLAQLSIALLVITNQDLRPALLVQNMRAGDNVGLPLAKKQTTLASGLLLKRQGLLNVVTSASGELKESTRETWRGLHQGAYCNCTSVAHRTQASIVCHPNPRVRPKTPSRS